MFNACKYESCPSSVKIRSRRCSGPSSVNIAYADSTIEEANKELNI